MDDALTHFASHGWAPFPEVFDGKSVEEVRQRLGAMYPTFEQFQSERSRYADLADGQVGGLKMWPLDDLVLDLVPLDARLVGLAETLLRTRDLRLLRAAYQAKYAQTVDFDQVLHYDYPNHSLVVPAEADIVGFFLYISDVADDLGPTALVSDAVRGPITPGRTHPDAKTWPELYAAERRAVAGASSVLAYRSTTYHRGTAITAPAGVRVTLGASYGRSAPWIGYTSFPRLGEDRGLVRAVRRMTTRQRELIGFPAPGDPFWSPNAVRALTERYPDIDPTPYAKGSA